ncbi:MAG: DUF2135 domain-containing protein [Marinilabiliaceae bacterium]|nr:DUF2135 domain-containing protein [Marinilabiliaceae bacterium]
MKPIHVYKLLLISLIGIISAVTCSQNTIPLEVPLDTHPQLTVTNDSIELEIATLKVDVLVTGNIATTTYDMTFYNPASRILEGALNFPLKANQQIVRFAMEVNGHLREGVIVEKHKGRQVFESIVREGIDPGLLEKTKGNNFKARVYPIPALGSKRIVVSSQEELNRVDQQHHYFLPLQFSSTIADFSLRLEVVKGHKKPKVMHNDFTPLTFDRWRDSYVAEVNHQKIMAHGMLAIALPASDKKESVFLSNWNDTTYFYASLPVKLKSQAKGTPKHLHLLWDVSGSGANRDIDKELTVLEGYFKNMPHTKVTLSTVNYQLREKGNFTIKEGQWQSLRQRLSALTYDGGSRMDHIRFDALSGDEIIWVTDGLANLGELADQTSHKPVTILNSATKANHTLLQQVALQSGGTYLDLPTLPVKEAVNLLRHQPLKVQDMDYSDGRVQQINAVLSPDEKQLRISGRLISAEASVSIELSNGRDPVEQLELNLSKEEVQAHLPSPRLWAMHQINELMARPTQHKARIIALAQEFGIVTDYTSLLVLDRLQDYIRFKIEPPAELKEQYDQYLAAQSEQQFLQVKNQNNQLTAWIDSYKKWWATDYPVSPQRPKKTSNEMDLADESPAIREAPITRQEEMRPPPPPPPHTNDVLHIVEDELEIEDSEMDEETVIDMEEEACDTPPMRGGRRNRRSRMTTSKVATPWDSTATYITRMASLPADEIYAYYLTIKKQYNKQPSFFLDVAAYLFEQKQSDAALSVITNLAELQLENAEIMRIAGHQLLQQGETNLAIQVFSAVLTMRPEELQSLRDLALALEQADLHQQALDMYRKALGMTQDRRFNGIKNIVLNEMNNLLFHHGDNLDTSLVDPQWRYHLPVDMRIVLSWSTDNSDVDLWVLEPSGEKCFYSYMRTWLGGRLSRDITQGYGPEEYLIKKAVSGTYQIKAHYYGDRRQTIAGPITLRAEIFQHYGTPRQTSRSVVIQLKKQRQVIDLGAVMVE